MIISLLVAADENNLIGSNNSLPWHLPNDLKYFKNLTWAMPVLMGRKTYESIGKPLPGRNNIVITRNRDWQQAGVTIVHSLEGAISAATEDSVNEIFVIGGAEIFTTSLAQANRIYLTRIHHRFNGDVYFPELKEPEWQLKKETFASKDDKNLYDHTFQVWEHQPA